LTKEREREREKWVGKISKEFKGLKWFANFMKVSEKERKKLTKLSLHMTKIFLMSTKQFFK